MNSLFFSWSLITNCCHLNWTGYGVGYDDVIVHGSLDDLKFAAFYTVYVCRLSLTVTILNLYL